MIGEEAQDNVGVMKRVYREGHEIGNHTWTHPDISEISTRPGGPAAESDGAVVWRRSWGCSRFSSVRRTPSIRNRIRTTRRRQSIASRRWVTSSWATRSIPNDWDEQPRKTPQEITDDVLEQIADDEDEAPVPRQHHPVARRRWGPQRDGGYAAGADQGDCARMATRSCRCRSWWARRERR